VSLFIPRFWAICTIETLKSCAEYNRFELILLIKAELHDIGKLIDTQFTGIEHNFDNYSRELETDTWRGIREHHCSDFDKYPISPDTFKLAIADQLASSISRYKVERKGTLFLLYKLWNPDSKKKTFQLIKSKEEIDGLVSFIKKDPTVEEFFDKYGNLLKERPEDVTLGKNITSLYTHSKLTGQFFRILMSDEKRFSVLPKEFNGLTREQVGELMKKKTQQWKMCQIRCRLNFSLTPIRAKDLNVFKVQEKIINDIKLNFPDNVFFNTSQEIFLIASGCEQILQKIKEKIKEHGLWSHITIAEIQVAGLKPSPEKIRGNKSGAIYPELPNRIEPPICELCQVRKAEQSWVDEESGIKEEICEKCWNVRSIGSLLPHLAEWEKSKQDFKVCWIKIWLNYEKLLSSLEKLYKEYLKSEEVKIPPEIDIRFTTVSEFQWDYEEFLSDLRNYINKTFGIENIQEILPDFIAVKITSLSQIKSVLSVYHEAFNKYFLKLRENDPPLQASIIASNVKFPFSETWRLLHDVKNEVNIHLINKGAICLKVKDVEDFLRISLPSKTLLHKIARIDDMSPKLGKIILHDRMDRDFWRYKGIREAIERYGHQNVLTYAKMMGD